MTIVAIHPIVDYWAEKAACSVRGIEELFDERAHRQLGAKVIDRVESLVAAIDAILCATTPKWQFAEAVSFAAFFHYANGTLDALVLRLEQVLGACDTLGAGSLVAFRPRGYPFSGVTSLDHAPWGLVTNIVPLVAATRGLDIFWIDAQDDDPSTFNPLRDIVPRPATSPSSASTLLWTQIRWIRARLREFAGRLPGRSPTGRESIRRAPERSPLLISSLFADLGDDVLESWVRRGGRVMGMNQSFPLEGTDDTARQATAACEVLWERAKRDPQVRKLLVWEGVDLWLLFEPWLQQVIREALPSLFQRAEVVWNRLVVEQAYGDAAFVAGGWITDHYVVARIAQRVGLPTVSYHYGGFLGFSLLPKHERFDFAECDYFLCGGVGAERALRLPALQARWNPAVRRAKPVATGIPWVAGLQAIRFNAPSTAKPGRRIMIVLNALLGDCRDLGFVFPPETEYWRFTRTVIERLAEKKDIDIVIKPPLRGRYPQMPNPVLDWLVDRGLSRVKVIGDVPLKDCLDLADAYIIESPSTPLLQVIATEKPLLLYINERDYLLQPDAAEALRCRAAVFAQSEAEFLTGLDNFLDAPEWLCRKVDDRFMRDYAIGESGATPAERISEFLGTAIAQRAMTSREQPFPRRRPQA